MKMNYYELFEININASQAEIKKAYRNLAKKYHPDNHQGDPAFDSKFKEINLVYAILSDQNKRRQYDESLNDFRNQNTDYIYNKNKKEYYSYRSENANNYNSKKNESDNEFKFRSDKKSITSSILESRLFSWAVTILFFYLLSTVSDFICNSKKIDTNEINMTESENDSSLNTGEIYFYKEDTSLIDESIKEKNNKIKSNETGDIKF
jgi:curved DNA-binding protein CbpA